MIVQRLVERIRGSKNSSLRWTIVTSAPKGEAGEQWGDTFFARDLAGALERAGQQAKVVSRSGATSDRRKVDDVVLVLRGLRSVEPPADRTGVWILWVISHPELVTAEELRAYDVVFVASEHWTAPGGQAVTPLLQATDPSRFHPRPEVRKTSEVLFVGSTRGEFRPVIEAALRSSRAEDVRIYGVGWAEFLDDAQIAGEFLPNDALPQEYARSQIVLNDHHKDMASAGFLSNRLFDAVASGARVLTDRAVGIDEVFGEDVVVYNDRDHLIEILSQPVEDIFADDTQRQAAAKRIAELHSFDARAQILVDRVHRIRGAA